MKPLAFLLCLALLLPRVQAQNPANHRASLRVVSWNIQMLPTGFLSVFSKALRKKQSVRLPWIIEQVKREPYEVVVFQEVFHKKMYRQLREALKADYPYQVETYRKGNKISNGIFIVSRLPMRYLGHCIYTEKVGIDGMASKGCTVVEVEKNGNRVQIGGTHLQSGGGDKEQRARDAQYLEIAQLLKQYQNDETAQLVVGDMNTERSIEPRYSNMLQTLNMRDFPLGEARPYTVDSLNTWTPRQQPEQIDYILLQPQQTKATMVFQRVLRPQGSYKNKPMDYADHYGVEAVLEWVKD